MQPAFSTMRRSTMRRAAFCAIALAASLAGSAPARAQNWPQDKVKLIVAYAPGGTGDFVARVIAPKLQEALGQPVIVENRPGASGSIGARLVASSAPDGYTLLVGQTGEISINQHWLKNLNYDPDKELQPIALAADSTLALVAPASAPWKTMAELVALAPKHPKDITFASAGLGTPGYFAGEWLKAKLRANMTHVPYNGAGPALNDLIGGHVDLYFPGFPAAVPLMKAGKLHVLAVSAGKRAVTAPDIPTVAETIRVPEFNITLWAGLFAPKATPIEVIERLNAETNKILAMPDIRQRLIEAGSEVNIMTVEQTEAFVRSESAKYQKIIQETGVQPR